MHRLLAILGTIALLALAGCGDDDGGRVDVSGGTDTAGADTSGTGTTTSEEAAPAGPATSTVKVTETEYRLSPQDPKVSKAGVVEFRTRNAGTIVHALEVEGPGGEVKVDRIEPGATATLKADLDKPGRYEWYCPIGDHKERGMKGEITVAGGGGAKKEDAQKKDDGGGGSKRGYGY